MAPELLSEGKQFNVLSDVYALAITIWEVRPHISLPLHMIDRNDSFSPKIPRTKPSAMIALL
jgi:hypothetical protein